MITMIVGVIAVVATLVTRMPDGRVPLPDVVTLPAGEVAQAVTIGQGWLAVVTQSQKVTLQGEK